MPSEPDTAPGLAELTNGYLAIPEKGPHHLVLSWRTYLALLESDAQRAERTQAIMVAYGSLPPAVEIIGGELSPVWADDPRMGAAPS